MNPPCEQAVAEAREVLAVLKANPLLHNQSVWLATGRNLKTIKGVQDAISCGTAGCFAGWLGVVAEAKLVEPTYIKTEDGDVHIANWAAERLGLPSYFGGHNHMFNVEKTIQELEEWVDAIAEACERGITVEKVAIERGLTTEQVSTESL
jgi:hypothetical protein